MRKILFISKGSSSSSTRYRAIDFFPLLKAVGWQPMHLTDRCSLPARLNILRTAAKVDAVVVVRRTFGRIFAQLLRQASRQLIFSFDDAIFAKSDGTHSAGREKKFAHTIPLCDHIWAGNSYLAEKAGQFNSNVVIIPTAIDSSRYNTPSIKKPSTTVDLVWIGSSSTKKHLVTALPALETAAESIPQLRLKIIADFSIESSKLEIEPIKWSQDIEAQELASAHIGIAPLLDNIFTQGKCGLKVLQYMASGLPVISSPTGVNKEMVEHGASGFLTANKNEWVEAIKILAQDADLRSAMGATGQKRCLGHFTLQATFQKMLASLKNGQQRP